VHYDDTIDADAQAFADRFIAEFEADRKEELARWGRTIREGLLGRAITEMIDTTDYSDLLWIDVEASGLHADSYPIEIGWCGVDLVQTSFLIKPIPNRWTFHEWSPSSEKVHGIGWNLLNEIGHDARDVAAWLNAATSGKIVLSDNPGYDQGWLNQLYFDTGIPMEFELMDAVHAAGVAAGAACLSQPEAQSILARIHSRFPHPHRAGPDARRSAAEFLAMAMPWQLDEIEAMA